MDALPFLEKAGRSPLLHLYVVHGDETFLRRQVLQAIKRLALGPDSADGLSVYTGAEFKFSDVLDELHTAPFFGERRLIVVEDGDKFVSDHRGLLEKALTKLSDTNVLVLDVKSWPANTRLAKQIDGAATIACKALTNYKVPQWCTSWAQASYGKKLGPQAAGLLVDLAGADLGLLDQEIAKLSIFIGGRPEIRADDVDKLVGQNREAETFKIFDAIGAGRIDAALQILDQLFVQGEEPMRLNGAFAWQLKKLAQAARLVTQGTPLPAALQQVGISPYNTATAQQQLKRIGRERANRLYDWLLELEMGLKGGSPLPPRLQFERLVVRLAK